MSAHVRSSARASGWPDHVVQSLSVQHKDGAFHVFNHGDKSAFEDLEYGTQSTPPNAAVHRSINRTAKAEDFFKKRVNAYLWGK